MRTKTELYNDLLKIQTELSFHNEITILKKANTKNIKTVLDYGCGNGYFIKKLDEKMNFDKIYCCDINDKILNCTPSNNKYIKLCGDYNNISLPEKVDLVVLRHLSSYLSDRTSFFKWINSNTTENALILLIDAFDENLLIEPIMPYFQKGLDSFYESVKNSGGTRNIFDLITKELSVEKFDLIDTIKIVVDSNTPNLKEKLFVYMSLVAELDNGLPLDEHIREELMQWVTNDNSYMQYGLFSSLYRRKCI